MKKNTIRTLCVSFAAVLTLTSLSSCNDQKSPIDTDTETVEQNNENRGHKINALTVNGKSINDYTVVTSSGSVQKNAGKIFADAVELMTGYKLNVTTDAPSDDKPVILIGRGKIKYEGLGAYSFDKNTVCIDGSFNGLESTVKYFIHDIFDLEENPSPSSAIINITRSDTNNVTEEKINSLKLRTVFVRPDGKDGASGTESDPVLTIRGAQARAAELLSFSPARVIYDIDKQCYYVGNLSLTDGMLDGKELNEEIKDIMNKDIPGIICWGDSLTQGVKESWPPFTDTLQKLITNNVNPDAKVINHGVGGESSATIVGRSGAIPFVLTSEVTIPAGRSSVAVPFTLSDGKYVTPLLQGASSEKVRFGGVIGTLTHNTNGVYTFVRDTEGKETTVPKGSELIFTYSEENLDYIPVIFMGQNSGWSGSADLVDQISAIRDKYEIAKGENGKYIVIGLASGTKKNRADLETAMEKAFGDHFINLREYFSTIGPYEAMVTPSDEDLKAMDIGITPPCLLLSDGVHFTKTGFELVGKLIYKRMSELGYFDNIKNAINAD